jgi:hypothetical protein
MMLIVRLRTTFQGIPRSKLFVSFFKRNNGSKIVFWLVFGVFCQTLIFFAFKTCEIVQNVVKTRKCLTVPFKKQSAPSLTSMRLLKISSFEFGTGVSFFTLYRVQTSPKHTRISKITPVKLCCNLEIILFLSFSDTVQQEVI